MVNVPLLQQTMRQIIAHPELHDQSQFFADTDCGTACCFGGWACMLAGFEQVGHQWPGVFVAGPGSEHGIPAWDTARDLLGLTDEQALTLFSPANSRSALESMVDDLVETASLEGLEHYHHIFG